LWLIKVWFSASTFVVKIATFAMHETVKTIAKDAQGNATVIRKHATNVSSRAKVIRTGARVIRSGAITIRNSAKPVRSRAKGIRKGAIPVLKHAKVTRNGATEILFIPIDKVSLLIKEFPEWLNYIFRVYHKRVEELLGVKCHSI
jgi:CRP/FNR family transcriptional regulator